MAKQSQNISSAAKLLSLVVGFGLVLVALVVFYKAVSTSTANKSKAGENEVIYKQWEFNGSDTEGWTGGPSVSLSGGYIHLALNQVMPLIYPPVPYQLPNLNQAAVNSVLPVGNKFIKLMVAVGPRLTIVDDGLVPVPTVLETGQSLPSSAGNTNNAADRPTTGFGNLGTQVEPLPNEVPSCPAFPGCAAIYAGVPWASCWGNKARCPLPSSRPRLTAVPLPSPGNQPYTLSVAYAVSGKPTEYIKIPSVTGAADGQLKEFVISIPNSIGELSISGLRLEFSNVVAGNEIRVDWIRLIGERKLIMPPVTPIACKTGLNSFTVEKPCSDPNKAKRVSYSCYDGYVGKLGNGTTCTTTDSLKGKALDACAKRVVCPTFGSTPTSRPSAPLPPGCSWKSSNCGKLSCPQIMVCQN